MRIPATLAITSLLLTPLAQAKEYPIGEPQQCGGMEVGAVYLQPVEMDPPGMMRAAAESTFGVPSAPVEWRTCRCRLDSSTTSSSTTPITPTPAAARYISVGEPRPPLPGPPQAEELPKQRRLRCEAPGGEQRAFRRWEPSF